MDMSLQNDRTMEMYRKVGEISSGVEFADFLTEISHAWKEGVFDEDEEGHQQDVLDYIEGLRGVTDAEVFDHETGEPDEFDPDWSFLAYLVLRAFGHS